MISAPKNMIYTQKKEKNTNGYTLKFFRYIHNKKNNTIFDFFLYALLLLLRFQLEFPASCVVSFSAGDGGDTPVV